MRFQVDYESWFKEKSGTSPVASLIIGNENLISIS
jgi:hypothetical protein